MWTPRERELLEQYEPLIRAELRRIGVSESDERWIHAGSDQSLTAAGLGAELVALRALPTGLGVEAYCSYLGIDYDPAKRDLSGPSGAT